MPRTPVASPAATSTPTRSPTPTPTPSPTLAPSPSPTATPAPTLDSAAVAATVAGGKARMEAADVSPLCLRYQDTDGDGETEWVGLYLRPEEPPQLAAFVLDGETWYDLRPLETEKHGLGEYPTCELEVRDANVDGRVEILVWGHAEASTDLLHIFVWDGTAYVLLAAFEGEAGVRLEDADGDLIEEVVVGYEAGNDLIWEAVYTWDGSNYGWTWERYAWFYLDRPHPYLTDTPERAVISFYLAIGDGDLGGAYGLLSPETQEATPAEDWMLGFVTTVGVEVGAVHELSRQANSATVTAQVRAYDNRDGRVIATLWDVEWTVVRTGGTWRLGRVTAEQLDSWESVY